LGLWNETLGFFQFWQRLAPLLAPHIDDAKVGIGGAGLRIYSQDLPKIALRFVQTAMRESVLAALKKLRRIGRFRGRTGNLIRRARRRLVRRNSHRRSQQYEPNESFRCDACA